MKKSFKAVALVVVAMIAAFALAGCSPSTPAAESQASAAESQASAAEPQTSAAESQASAADAKGDGSYTLALVPPAMISPYYAAVIEGAQGAADAAGCELVTLAPESESDYAAQVQIVEDMITQKVDGIILCAINSDAIISAVKKANDASIPVVMFNTQNELAGGEVAAYIKYDQYEAGAKVCDYVAEVFNGKANVAIIEGLPSDHTTERKGGFVDRATEKYPDIKIVASQPGDWEREKGMNAATNMLQANPDINVLFGLSDEMALGAVQAVEQANSSAKVAGFDGNPNAVAAVRDGKMMSTLSIGGPETGKLCVDTLIKILNGETVEKIIPVDTTVVTIDNAADFKAE